MIFTTSRKERVLREHIEQVQDLSTAEREQALFRKGEKHLSIGNYEKIVSRILKFGSVALGITTVIYAIQGKTEEASKTGGLFWASVAGGKVVSVSANNNLDVGVELMTESGSPLLHPSVVSSGLPEEIIVQYEVPVTAPQTSLE